jgi:outer membrane protein
MILVALLLVTPATQVFADLKVGYVNAVRVIEEAPQGVAALKKLETEFSQRDKELVALQNRIRQLDDELQKNVPAQKETDRRAREREALMLKRELKRATAEFREDYNQRRNEELAVLQQVVRKAILDIAKQEKYDLVLHEGTVYASDSIDITEKVLKKLGKQ